MKNIIINYFTIFLFIVLLSCEKELPDPSIERYSKTVIVYMTADNDLSERAMENIKQMKNGLDSDDRNLIVYLDSKKEDPAIIKIQKTGNIIIKTYPDQNSATIDVFQQIFKDIIVLYPSDSYGLVLWSHGTSWIPEGIELRSFGFESGRELDIRDLSLSLPLKFDFILFDACLMGSVEVVFQMRKKANYIIVSSTEVISNGFPYEEITSLMFGGEVEYIKLAEEYFSHYSNLKGKRQSATISVIKTDELNNLAHLASAIIHQYPLNKRDYNQDTIQSLDLLEGHISYDFLDFLDKNYPPSAVSIIKEQLNKTILYKGNTKYFLNTFSINRFCGLSCYIPSYKIDNFNLLDNYYQSLSWCQASGFHLLF